MTRTFPATNKTRHLQNNIETKTKETKIKLILKTKKQQLTKNNMVSFIKRNMNTEFKDALDEFKGSSGSDWFDPEYDMEEDGFDFKTYKKYVGQGKDYSKVSDAGMEVNKDYWKEFGYYEYDMNCEKINIDMIEKIERDTILDVVVLPLQKKIKEILYDPNTRRGKAFALNNIAWAFE